MGLCWLLAWPSITFLNLHFILSLHSPFSISNHSFLSILFSFLSYSSTLHSANPNAILAFLDFLLSLIFLSFALLLFFQYFPFYCFLISLLQCCWQGQQDLSFYLDSSKSTQLICCQHLSHFISSRSMLGSTFSFISFSF